jgi:hypothetical protein
LLLRLFKINYTGLKLQLDTKNYFVLQYHVAAYERVEHDISIGRTAGTFRFRLLSNLRCSLIGLVSKKTYDWSLITHLSYPHGNSVSAFIDEQLYSFLNLKMSFLLFKH